MKQLDTDQTTHAYGIDILHPLHPSIKKLKLDYPTALHGDKVWDSSYLLMDYLSQNPPKKGAKVLELGCGWGLASIYLNKFYQCEITAVDADPDVFPYARLQAEVNSAKITTRTLRFEDISEKLIRDFDIIIAADVCFWDSLTAVHRQLVDRAINADIEQIIYTDPCRQPFIELAEYCAQQHFAQIEEVELEHARGAIMVINNQ